jgi:hypothetical protein
MRREIPLKNGGSIGKRIRHKVSASVDRPPSIIRCISSAVVWIRRAAWLRSSSATEIDDAFLVGDFCPPDSS